jgi:hypothetical protein
LELALVIFIFGPGLLFLGFVVLNMLARSTWEVEFEPPEPKPERRGFEVKLVAGQSPVTLEERENDHG